MTPHKFKVLQFQQQPFYVIADDIRIEDSFLFLRREGQIVFIGPAHGCSAVRIEGPEFL